jgi:hypothetical protein
MRRGTIARNAVAPERRSGPKHTESAASNARTGPDETARSVTKRDRAAQSREPGSSRPAKIPVARKKAAGIQGRRGRGRTTGRLRHDGTTIRVIKCDPIPSKYRDLAVVTIEEYAEIMRLGRSKAYEDVKKRRPELVVDFSNVPRIPVARLRRLLLGEA